MSVGIYEPNIAKALRGRVLSFLAREGTNARLFFDAVSEVLQTYEDLLFDVYVSSTLNLASGEDLRVWGQYAGVVQGGLTSAEFKRVIRARLAALVSQGDIASLERVVVRALGIDEESVTFEESTATIRVVIVFDGDPGEALRLRLLESLRLAKREGIALRMTVASAASVRFDTEGAGFDGPATFATTYEA